MCNCLGSERTLAFRFAFYFCVAAGEKIGSLLPSTLLEVPHWLRALPVCRRFVVATQLRIGDPGASSVAVSVVIVFFLPQFTRNHLVGESEPSMGSAVRGWRTRSHSAANTACDPVQ